MADYISVREEFDADFYDLKDRCWSGALDTLQDIENAGVEDEFMNHLSDVFFDEVPELTELNDYIWFERDDIYEACGLDENGEPKRDAEGIKAEMDLSVDGVSDQGTYDGNKYVTVDFSDANSDFGLTIDYYQPVDGGDIEPDVSDYVMDDDGIYAELADDMDVTDEAERLGLDYLEANGYIVDGNLIVRGEE